MSPRESAAAAGRGSRRLGRWRSGVFVRGGERWVGSGAALLVAILAAAELAIALRRLQDGGLYQDDWPITWIRRYDGFWGLFDNLVSANHLRPLAGLYFALTDSASVSIAGQAQTMISFALHLLVGFGVYLLLRRLRLPALPSVGLVALVLLFPWSDSTWLWYAASVGNAAFLLALLGGWLTLIAASSEGRRGLILELAAGIAFALSVLTYQVAAAVCLLIALVGIHRDWRRAIRRLVINAVLVGLSLSLPLLITGSTGSTSAPTAHLSAWPGNAWKLADSTITLLVRAVVPYRSPHRNVVLPVLIVLCAVLLSQSRGEPGRPVRRWLGWAAAGIALAVTAYVIYVPAPRGLYDPLAPANANRVNLLGGIGIEVFVFGLAMAAGATCARRLSRPLIGDALAAGLIAFLAVGYFTHARRDARGWAAAAVQQRADLARIESFGRLPAHSTDFVSGLRTTSIAGLDVFHFPWELRSAAGLSAADPTLYSYPVTSGIEIVCGLTAILREPTVPAEAETGPYGRSYFTDLISGRRVRITNRAKCNQNLAGLAAGVGP